MHFLKVKPHLNHYNFKVSLPSHAKKEGDKAPSEKEVSGRGFKMVVNPPIVQRAGIPGRGSQAAMPHLFPDFLNRPTFEQAINHVGVSELMRRESWGDVASGTEPFKLILNVKDAHWYPTTPATEKQVIQAGRTVGHRDEAPVVEPELNVCPRRPANRHVALFFAFGVSNEDAPPFQVYISKPYIYGLRYSQATIKKQAKDCQVSDLPPSLVIVLFSLGKNPLDLIFQVAKEGFYLVSRWRPGQIIRLDRPGQILKRVIGNDLTLDQPGHKRLDNLEIREGGIVLIFGLTVTYESGKAFDGRRPVRANCLVNLQGPAVMRQSIVIKSLLGKQIPLYGSI